MTFFSIRRVLAYAWDIYAHQAAFLSALLIFMWALTFGNHFITIALIEKVSFGVGMGVFLVGLVVSVLFSMGYTYMTIQLVRKKPIRHEDLLTPAPSLFRYLVASILYVMIVGVGLCLFIVPGVVWAVKYAFYRHLIIDQDLDPLQALYISGRLTANCRLKLLGSALVLLLVNLGGLLLFGIGLLITIPVTALAWSRIYHRLVCALEKRPLP